jgi:CubicO group peptidase (beta-lactamase class C family)
MLGNKSRILNPVCGAGVATLLRVIVAYCDRSDGDFATLIKDSLEKHMTSPEAYGFSTARLKNIDRFIADKYVATGKLPGAQVLIARRGGL